MLLHHRYCLWLLLMPFLLACGDDKDDYYIDQQPAVTLPADMAFSTGLPVVIIDTPSGQPIDSKTEWMEETAMRIVLPNGDEAYSGVTAIRGRGNITWKRYPKKPYSLKLTKKTPLLGMGAAKRWVLLSNWADRTLLRNDVAFEVARHTSLRWTPQGAPVELILNGVYHGSYYLCEKIQIHENRLNIVEMDEDDEQGQNITGGYLMEIDKYFDEPCKFRSVIYQLPYQFRSPDEDDLTASQFAYMENFIAQFEASIADDESLLRGEYAEWIDPLSFVDWWIVNELCFNKEVSKPKSVYLFKQRGEPLAMGPVWDFDYSSFTPREDIYVAKRFPYLRRLFMDSNFQRLARQRWAELRPEMLTMPEYIDHQAAAIRLSNEQNIRMWPISLKLNGDEQMTFDEAVERMKESFLLRWSVIDNYLSDSTNVMP